MNKMNKNELNRFMDKAMEIVNDSDNRTSLIKDISYLVEKTFYDRGAYGETEIVCELSELMEISDEYGFTELKQLITEICDNYGYNEKEEEEEEEMEEEEPTNYGYGYINDIIADGKARAEIVKLLVYNTPALIGNDNEVNNAIIKHIAEILHSLADRTVKK